MTPADKNPYEKSLSDSFWLNVWGRHISDKNRIAESLQSAALNNNLWRAEYLLTEKKADVNTGDGFCVRWAAESGHCEMIRLLARHGADINAKDGEALIRAAGNGHVAAAKTLLENGADVSKQNYQALRVADQRGDAAFIRTLLNSGHDFTKVATELMEAAGGAGLFDKAGLYSQYLDKKSSPSPAARVARNPNDVKPPKP